MTTLGNLTQVFVGNVANDGTGATLRDAFITVNDNMGNLYTALGNPIGSSIISNSSGFSFNAGDTIVASFSANVLAPDAIRAVKFIASISNDVSDYQVSELLLLQNGTNANLQITGEAVMPAGPAFVKFSANILSGNVLLWGTTLSVNNVVKFQTISITV